MGANCCCCRDRLPASTQTHAFFRLPRSASTDRLHQAFEEADSQLLEATARVKAAEQALGTNTTLGNTYNFSIAQLNDKLKECEEMINRLKAAKSDFDKLQESLDAKKEFDPEDEYKANLLAKQVYMSKKDLTSQLADFREATEQLSGELSALPLEGLETNTSIDRNSMKLGVLQRLLRGKHREELRKWWGKWGKSWIWRQFGTFDVEILREIEKVLKNVRTALQHSRGFLNDYQTAMAEIAHLIRSKEPSSPALQTALSALDEKATDLQKAQESGFKACNQFQREIEVLGRREERETERLAALESHLVMEESREGATEEEIQELGKQWKMLFLLKERLGEAKEAIRQLETALSDIKKTLEIATKSTLSEEIVFEDAIDLTTQSKAGQQASNPSFEFEFTEEKTDIEEQINEYLAYVSRTAAGASRSPRDYLRLYLQEKRPQEEAALVLFTDTVRQEANARADSFVSLLAELLGVDANREDSLAVLYALATVAPSAWRLSQSTDLAAYLTTGGQIYLKDAISAVYFLCQASPSLGESLLLSIRPASISLIQHLIFMICFRLQESQTDSLTFFKAVDSDSSKRLSLSELATGLRAKLGLWMREEQVVMAFRELDKDKSGEVTRLEFTKMINLKEYYARCEREEYRVTVREFGRKVRETVSQAERRDVEAVIRGFRTV